MVSSLLNVGILSLMRWIFCWIYTTLALNIRRAIPTAEEDGDVSRVSTDKCKDNNQVK